MFLGAFSRCAAVAAFVFVITRRAELDRCVPADLRERLIAFVDDARPQPWYERFLWPAAGVVTGTRPAGDAVRGLAQERCRWSPGWSCS